MSLLCRDMQWSLSVGCLGSSIRPMLDEQLRNIRMSSTGCDM